jgi:hypothetical protein
LLFNESLFNGFSFEWMSFDGSTYPDIFVALAEQDGKSDDAPIHIFLNFLGRSTFLTISSWS